MSGANNFLAAPWPRLPPLFILGFIAYAVSRSVDTPSATVSPSPQKKMTCTAADFEIIGFTPRVVDDCTTRSCPVLKLTGKLKNNCSIASGAQIKITALDAKGNVVDTYEGWPASIRNIQPGEAYAFNSGPGMDYRHTMKSFRAEVIEARTWR
jgi:hypothetical protein